MTTIQTMGNANIKSNGKIDQRCINCFYEAYQRLFDKFRVEESQRIKFYSFFTGILSKSQNMITPEIQRELKVKLCDLIGVADPFIEEKKISNAQALDLYEEWKPKVLSSEMPFDLALRLSIAGNIMDYGASGVFNVYETINYVLNADFAIDHTKQLKNGILNAKRILYLGDNAGEIVFDKLFIETIMHNDVYYSVRSAPVLNDVTMDDAKAVGMDLVADVITNGFDAPSTVLSRCSKEFLDIYESSDLVISKGQGNFEGLMELREPKIFFLLMAKCDVIAETLGVKKGSFIVYNPNSCNSTAII